MECFQHQLLATLRASQSDPGPRRLLLGIRILKKFKWIPPIVVPMDCNLVEAVNSFYKLVRGSSTKYRESMGCLRTLYRFCSSAVKWELTALDAIRVFLGLRAKEAITVSFADGDFH